MYQVPSLPTTVPSVTSVLGVIDKPQLRAWQVRTCLRSVQQEFQRVQVGCVHRAYAHHP
jgi:hypothetical protein